MTGERVLRRCRNPLRTNELAHTRTAPPRLYPVRPGSVRPGHLYRSPLSNRGAHSFRSQRIKYAINGKKGCSAAARLKTGNNFSHHFLSHCTQVQCQSLDAYRGTLLGPTLYFSTDSFPLFSSQLFPMIPPDHSCRVPLAHIRIYTRTYVCVYVHHRPTLLGRTV